MEESPNLSDAKNETNHQGKVPYRATKLWLEALEIFRSGVKLGKHRQLLRQYDNCFIAQEAVTWFNQELQRKFDVSITRKQTLYLLQKFYKAGIFTAATNNPSTTPINKFYKTATLKETDFKDNGRLYKFINSNVAVTQIDNSLEGSSDSASSNANPDYYVIINSLSQDQIYEIWEQAFIERFVHIVGYDVYTSFLKPGAVKGAWIFHNLTKVGPNGVVVTETPLDDLPGWLLNAMKCITRWPNDYMLEGYTGFESDVFLLIRNYFNTFKDVSPLLTFELHDAFITTFIRASVFDVNNRLYTAKTGKSCKYNSKSTICRADQRFVQEQYPFSASESVENLLMDIFTPEKKATWPGVHGNHYYKKSMQPRRILGTRHSNILEGNEHTENRIQPMVQQSYDIKKYFPKPLSPVSAKSPVFLETAFTSDKSPITRIISTAEMESSLGALRRPSTLRISKNSLQFAYENPLRQVSPPNLVRHPKYSKLVQKSELTSSTNSSLGNSFKSHKMKNTVSKSPEEQFTKSLNTQFMPDRPFSAYRSKSASNLSDGNRDRSPYAPSSLRNKNLPGHPQSILAQYASSPNRSAQKTMMMYRGATISTPSLMTAEGKTFAIVSFRLLTLLISPKNRRYLHILLRCMSKMSKNEKLMLDVGNTTRGIVINEFSKAILGCAIEEEYDEFLTLQIVTFMMDNIEEIFDTSKEQILKKAVEEQITEQQIVKVPTDVLDEKENNGRSSCSRISKDEYDDQRLLGSTGQSLRDLLEIYNLIDDPTERKSRLKQFRKEYPFIFSEKFGDAEDAAGLESSTEKDKKHPLRVLRSLF